MMYKKYTAVVLAVLVLAAEANTVNKVSPVALEAAPKIDGWGESANVNEYVDNTLHMLIPFMQNNGLDPMALPDVVEGFEVRPLLITYSAWLKITNGRMTGLVNMQRSGDQMVHYFAKMVRSRIELQFTDLRFDYNYLVQVMNLGPTGGIVATLSRFVIVVDVLIDFNNDEIHLQEFSMNDIGRLRVRFTGNILTDWLVNPVLNVFIRIFDTIIIKVVEVNIRNAVVAVIGILNHNIAEIISTLESIN
ncbi:mite allergen Der f 7-like [Pectinophora gossypiella]|uniref:mite allergen Der f 7-like n=1 Tax=Pectinophora gossypiella TaxID=13191 RepID=UPI00214F31D1|nr:mite allergen Der f 7-like [Pectinophora gossypiella]